MRTYFTILFLIFCSASFGNEGTSKNEENQHEVESLLIDKSKALILSRSKKQIIIQEGEKVFIRVDKQKYKGPLQILNDSTVQINDSQIKLTDIDVVAKVKTAKTIGLAFAALPIEFTGLVLIGGGFAWGNGLFDPISLGGIATMGVGIVGATPESMRGKGYHAFSVGTDVGPDTRKWHDTINY